MEGVQLQGEAAKRRAESDKDVKVAKLTEEDDIVSYLTMFERVMVAFEVKREKWAYKLASNLSGKAQKAYAALSPAEAGDYDKLKEAILRRYDITEESYRQRFRAGKRGREESNRELVARLNDLANKWMKEKGSREQVVDQIVLEQFLKTERQVERGVISGMKRQQGVSQPGVLKSGVVEGKYVGDILLDTGCSRTLVHQKLVSEDKLKDAGAVAIRCAHGDTVLYPLADISLEVNGKQIAVEAAVSGTLPMSVLLGTDTPELAELLVVEDSREAGEAFAVTTRAREKKELERENQKRIQEEVCGVQPSPRALDEDSSVWMREIDDDLFGRSKVKERKTRSEKREEKRRREQLQVDLEGEEEESAEVQELDDDVNQHELDISAEELKTLQTIDVTLRSVRDAVKTCEAEQGIGFFTRDGLLYRRWVPSGRREEEMAVEQLVLPEKCRETVMKLAHSIPLAGHLGRDKTTRRILQRFYWPTVHRDVADYCRGCDVCQKRAGKNVPRAPLIPLPVISQPFERIAMDIVGPLTRSSRGNRFVLVVCDYATRYPEAVPMKHVDAASVAEELVRIFSRVGVPKEILTDQGTNFTSHLLAELYNMLHVRPIRTTPYHPQTDGLVERFNRTLKMMLRKTAVKEGVDWDVMLPYLLFAYREVPQASTGFSPFELLYGHHVRGPLDVLSETWQSSTKSEESVVSHVLSIRDKLEKMKYIADGNLEQAQLRQKVWYDKNSREREFQPNDMVLLLLPTATSKLLAQWQGPFRVVKKVGRVNYEIEMPHRRKKKQTYHTNLLKKWEPPSVLCSMASEVDDEDEDFPDWRENKTSQPVFGSQLTDSQRDDLAEILSEFKDVLQGKPGQTHVTEHTIDTDAKPVRLPPYRIPYAYREEVMKELQEMEESGIIEPSRSEWASPIVVARKKDGGIRLCVDYRKLNASTPMDAYPMPRTDELLDKLGNAKYITTLDLARGYWQVPMAEKDRPKTAFITPNGLYQFRVMPFGLNGAPATFQRMMDQVIRGLESFSGDYLDDIAIFSDTWEEHLRHIKKVLLCLRESNLTAKPRKCQFGMQECVYLGFVVGNGHVKPDPTKLKAVEEYPVPETKKQVRGFLGLTGYYRRFIEDYAQVAVPLTDLTRKSLPDRVKWTPSCEAAFVSLKKTLCQSPILSNPDFNKTFYLQTDASNRGVGAVLSQLAEDGQDQPIAYFSRKLLPREVKYSTVEKECLAIKLGIEAFRVYLLGRTFIVQTDHRSLVWLDKLKDKNARLERWSLILQQYSFTVQHRKGLANGNADELSRASLDYPDQSNAGEGERSVADYRSRLDYLC